MDGDKMSRNEILKEITDRYNNHLDLNDEDVKFLLDLIKEQNEEVDYWKVNYYVKAELSMKLSDQLKETEEKLEAMWKLALSED
jgi:hypothetical protein